MPPILGEIITFYSYKGGTGRSMALSNVACILAERQSKGKGVLMIDWDLEAPGLHRFFHNKFKKRYKISSESENEFTLHPGLLDLFLEVEHLTPRKYIHNGDEAEKSAIEVLKKIDLQKFVIKTDIPNLSLLKAGSFDKNYFSKVNSFDWEDLYNRSPYLFISFAEKLVRKYKYILIDSRTGYTDISGICTALLPNKLVVVFVPNRQNYDGIIETIQTATDYRRKSEDLRPLLIYPLPSRIELSEYDLRTEWLKGAPEKGIEGYEPMFQDIFKKVYNLDTCDLSNYFDEIMIQQIPFFAYGEEIAVKLGENEDRLSLSKSYKIFTNLLIESAIPWQIPNRDLSKPEKAIDYMEQALKIGRELGNRRNEGVQLGNLGNAYRDLGNPKKAIEYYQQSLEISIKIGDRLDEGDQLGNLGNAYRDLGELKKAIKYYEQALKIVSEIGDRSKEGIWIGNQGIAYRFQGKLKKAFGSYEKALRIAEQVGDKRNEGIWRGNLGIVYLDKGELEKASGYYEQALKIAEQIGDKRNVGIWYGNLGIAYYKKGDPKKAIDFYEKALKIAEQIGDKRYIGVWQGYKGDAYFDMGDPKKAIDFYEKALKIAEQIDDKRRKGKWQGHIGNAYLDLGDPKKAIEYYEQALKIASEIGDRRREGTWLEQLGNAHLDLRDPNKAIGFLRESLTIGKEIEDKKIINYCEQKLKEFEGIIE